MEQDEEESIHRSHGIQATVECCIVVEQERYIMVYGVVKEDFRFEIWIESERLTFQILLVL
jgi:hypothetical protein